MSSKTFAEIWASNGITTSDVWIHTASLPNGLNVQINGLLLPVAYNSSVNEGYPVGIPRDNKPSTDFPFFYTNNNFIRVFQDVVDLFYQEDAPAVVGILISASHNFVSIVRGLPNDRGTYSWEAYRICEFYDTVQTFMSRLRGFQFHSSNPESLDLTIMDYIENPGTWQYQGVGLMTSSVADALAAQELYRTHFGIQVRQPWSDSEIYTVS